MRWPFTHRGVPFYWHEAYRLPLTGVEATGIAVRRADLAMWCLVEAGALSVGDVRKPCLVSFQDTARVHTASYVESLFEANTLARIFAVEPSDIPVDGLMNTVRLACG